MNRIIMNAMGFTPAGMDAMQNRPAPGSFTDSGRHKLFNEPLNADPIYNNRYEVSTSTYDTEPILDFKSSYSYKPEPLNSNYDTEPFNFNPLFTKY